MKIALSSKPESNWQLLLRSLKLYKSSFTHVFGLSIFLSLIIFLPRIVSLSIDQDVFASLVKHQSFSLLLMILNIFAAFIFTAILWRMRCIIIDEHESILDDLSIATKKIIKIVIAGIIQFLIIGTISLILYFLVFYLIQNKTPLNLYLGLGISLLSVLVAIYVYYLFIFYLPLILTEDKSFFNSLTKSANLVWKNWWRVFLLQITPIVSYVILLMLIKIIFQIDINIYLISPSMGFSVIATLLNLFILAFFIPFKGAILLMQLHDIEMRKSYNS